MQRTHHRLWPFGAFLCAASLAGLAAVAIASEAVPVVYPAKGQTGAQQDKDRYECHDWARGQSGYDPSQPRTAMAATQPPTTPTTAGATSGAQSSGSQDRTGSMVRGAINGAAVAELTHHDAGRGAATGVLTSQVLGRMKEQQAAQARQQQQAQQQQQAAQQQAQRQALQQAGWVQQRSVYERAFGACLEARGYVVR